MGMAIFEKESFEKSSIKTLGISFLTTIIYNSAFSYSNDLYSLDIDFCRDIYIGEDAFSHTQIHEIKLNPSNIFIDTNSFANCYNLEYIRINSDKSLTIKKESFPRSGIKFISITSEGDLYLEDCWANGMFYLTQIEINHNDQFIYKDDTYLLAKTDPINDEYDLLVLARSNLEHAFIDCNIKTIGAGAFLNCRSLSSAEFPINSKLQSIGDYAFCLCHLENILIPCHVSVIGEYSLVCDSDTSIKFAENSELQLIKNSALGLKWDEFSLPPYIMRIGNSFVDKLKSLKFDENTEFAIISKDSLSYTDIESLTLPTGMIEFEDGWCEELSKLTNINVPQSNNQYFFANNQFLLSKSNPTIENFDSILFAIPVIRTVTIPSFIKVISAYSFCNCSSLYGVIFKENSELNSIEEKAFKDCKKITSFVLPAKISNYGLNAFYGCYNLQIIEIQRDLNTDEINRKFVGYGMDYPKSFILMVAQSSNSNLYLYL